MKTIGRDETLVRSDSTQAPKDDSWDWLHKLRREEPLDKDFVDAAQEEVANREGTPAIDWEQISSLIEEGWAEGERGELIPGEQVKREMEAMKVQWLSQNKRS